MRVNGVCGKLKKYVVGKNRKFVIVGNAITVGIKWTPVVYKGCGVPTFIKSSAIKVITRTEYNSQTI